MLLLEFAIGYAGFAMMPKETEFPKYVQYAFFPFTAAWIAADSVWGFISPLAILAVPFCISSIIIEERVLRRGLSNQLPSVLRATTKQAGILSYIFLSLLALLIPVVVVAEMIV